MIARIQDLRDSAIYLHLWYNCREILLIKKGEITKECIITHKSKSPNTPNPLTLFFFFCKQQCIRKEPTVQPLQGGKETEGGARPLQVGGGGEKEKKMGMQPE
jgi:hypothetical protein